MNVSRYVGAVVSAVLLSASAYAQAPTSGDAPAAPAQPNVVIINPATSASPAAPAATGTPETAAVTGVTAAPAATGTPEAPAATGVTAAPSPASPAPGAVTAATPASSQPPQPGTALAPAAAPAGAAEAKPEAVVPPPPPEPTLLVDIDLGVQRMTVSEGGAARYTWPISSARYGYRTPTGTFQPTWMSKMWYSRQYEWAPMPNAIFFSRGTAIHATYATRMLGRPASHGCVRLAPANAATLFKLVGKHGKGLTRIVVHGTPNDGPDVAERREGSRYASVRRGYAYPPGYGTYDSYYAYDAPYYAPRPPRVVYYAKPRRFVQQRRYYRGYGYSYGYGF
jgi:lipoprotein-anchoring transpeptidase ErfK/SrfK